MKKFIIVLSLVLSGCAGLDPYATNVLSGSATVYGKHGSATINSTPSPYYGYGWPGHHYPMPYPPGVYGPFRGYSKGVSAPPNCVIENHSFNNRYPSWSMRCY
jgi:hypothetical protein